MLEATRLSSDCMIGCWNIEVTMYNGIITNPPLTQCSADCQSVPLLRLRTTTRLSARMLLVHCLVSPSVRLPVNQSICILSDLQPVRSSASPITSLSPSMPASSTNPSVFSVTISPPDSQSISSLSQFQHSPTWHAC